MLVRRQAPAAGPMAQGVDFFAHSDGQWRRCLQRVHDPVGGQLAFGGEGSMKRCDDRLLNFSAAESFGGGGESGDVEPPQVALPLFAVNGKDLRASFEIRQVEKEDVSKSAFAQKL